MTQEREALEAEMARFGDGRMLPIQWIKGFERGWLGRKKYEAALAAREEPPGVNEDREVTSGDADRCGRIMIGFGGEGSHHPTCKLPKGHDGACSEAALAAREEPQEFILPARFSRDDLQSDQAFHAAEEVLTGTFGEPSPEEAHADLYGQIIDAVCDDLAAREDTERPTVRHHEELQRAYEEALGRANRAEKSLREDIERPGITEYVTTREWKPELGRDQSLGDAIEEAIADGILVVRDPEQEPEQ